MSFKSMLSHPSRLMGSHRSLMSAFAGVGFLKLVSVAASVLTTVVLARLLGPEHLGAYAFALSLASMLVLPLLQGLPTLILREVAKAPTALRSATAASLMRFADRLSVGLALLAAAIVGLLVLLQVPGMATQRPWFTILSALWPIVMAAALFRGSVVRAYGGAVAGQLPDLLIRPLVFLVFLGALWLAPIEWRTAASAMSLNLLAALIALALAIVLMRRCAGFEVLGHSPALPERRWFGALLPLSVVGGLQLVNSQVDLVALGLLAPPQEVGVYKIASTLALQVSFALTVVNAVVAPRFAALYQQGKIAELRRVNRMGAGASFTAGAVVVLIYVVFGRQLISLTVGDAYLPAFMPLLILSAAHLATLWAGTTNILLNMIGRERDVLASALASMAANVVLNWLLIPRMGMTGAAIGMAASLVVWRMLLSVYVNLRLESRPQ